MHPRSSRYSGIRLWVIGAKKMFATYCYKTTCRILAKFQFRGIFGIDKRTASGTMPRVELGASPDAPKNDTLYKGDSSCRNIEIHHAETSKVFRSNFGGRCCVLQRYAQCTVSSAVSIIRLSCRSAKINALVLQQDTHAHTALV